MAKDLEKDPKKLTTSEDEVINFRELDQEEVVTIEDDGEELVLDLDTNEEDTGAHDDYDWTLGKFNKVSYAAADYANFEAQYDATLNAVQEFEIVSGKVLHIGANDIMLDMNYKSDGIIPRTEFRDQPGLAVGQNVEVYVESQEDKKGQLVLSRRKAKILLAWENIVNSFKEGRIIKGTVISKTKGGLIVDVDGLETFLPGSQIDVKPILDYDIFVGKTMEFKVVKINEAIKNAVVSHKALIESDLEAQRAEIISGLERGQVLEGTVKNITDFGAFLDLGGVDGLLYITDISWGRIKHPSDALELNQKVNVVVLDFDDDKRRISLGLKQLTPHPWEVLAADISEGSVVKGRIVNVEDYGAFLEILPGVEGLIHVSEVSWSNQPINARDHFKIGAEFDAKVVTLDRDERKMSLSLKQLSEDPWENIEGRFEKNIRIEGEVKNITAYGIFVEIAPGIGGMIHISDLSWTKRYGHPSEFTKVGSNIDTIILDIDKENRKLSLGHKQLDENPWDTFESLFPVGSFHEATIVRKDDRGAIVALPYGLEAFSPIRHLKKDDGSVANAEETLMFKVIEFNRDDKRILVSHTRYLEDLKKDSEEEDKSQKRTAQEETRKEIKKSQDKVEKSTLGEIEGFSALKEQLKKNDDEA